MKTWMNPPPTLFWSPPSLYSSAGYGMRLEVTAPNPRKPARISSTTAMPYNLGAANVVGAVCTPIRLVTSVM
jgi:hypothetical protein